MSTGRLLRCQVGGPGSTWLPILGERTTRISYERQPITVTAASESWQTRIGGGLGQRIITVGGIARRGAAWLALRAAIWLGEPLPIRLLSDTEEVFSGEGLVGSLATDGIHDGAQMFQVSILLTAIEAEPEPAGIGELYALDNYHIGINYDLSRMTLRHLDGYLIA